MVKDKDLKSVFDLMDLSESGRISYNDFCDVIEKNQVLPIEKIVRKRKLERNELYIEGIGEDGGNKLDFDFGQTQNIKSVFGEVGGSQRKDLGTVDGLSEIMRRTDIDMDNK